MKHLKQHPYLATLYGIILLSFTVALFDEMAGITVGLFCMVFLFLFSYFHLKGQTKTNMLLLGMRDEEILKLRVDIFNHKKEYQDYIDYMKSFIC